MWIQETIILRQKMRGFHLITDEILSGLPVIGDISIGLLHLFLQHTSASLSINENADPTVRDDFENFVNRLVPENQPYYRHTLEGSDDMPAHIKSSLFGNTLSIPISHGNLAIGTWQGIYFCEHRNHGGSRSIVATIHGDRG